MYAGVLWHSWGGLYKIGAASVVDIHVVAGLTCSSLLAVGAVVAAEGVTLGLLINRTGRSVFKHAVGLFSRRGLGRGVACRP